MADPVSAISALALPVTGEIGKTLSSADAEKAAATFGAALKSAGENFAGTMAEGDRMALRGIIGNAGPREVVDAVMTAEQTLQAAVAIRDKIVSAYLEISRMSI
ncbi:flagellar hook-basal body complex protein FliE [Zhengella mangrovi]|uniref:Flagellar hook-basal body complex protein FliE n=1 Tax=Zhengella mangrovi TaxID=1982044 RepID=A0A2G1QJW7_9HYPH|nr:flagellar hook-basal body complex protein FliE [Zhengella mangrovi]PHP65740.1 flagellar hook-basal body complex protein FliE [Zhengella mangrovi]